MWLIGEHINKNRLQSIILLDKKRKMEKIKSLKKDDKILIIKTRNGNQILNGQIVTVVRGFKSPNTNFTVMDKTGRQFTMFNSYPNDEYAMADRQSLVVYYNDRLLDLAKQYKEDIEEAKSKLDYYARYDSEEDYVAHKLENILTAHSNNPEKSSRVGAIRDVLKTMKDSDLL